MNWRTGTDFSLLQQQTKFFWRWTGLLPFESTDWNEFFLAAATDDISPAEATQCNVLVCFQCIYGTLSIMDSFKCLEANWTSSAQKLSDRKLPNLVTEWGLFRRTWICISRSGAWFIMWIDTLELTSRQDTAQYIVFNVLGGPRIFRHSVERHVENAPNGGESCFVVNIKHPSDEP